MAYERREVLRASKLAGAGYRHAWRWASSRWAVAVTTTARPATARRQRVIQAAAARSRSPICRTARARSARSTSRTSRARTPRSSSSPAARPPGPSRSDGLDGAKVAGKDIKIVGIGCANDTADKAIEETRRLMEQEDADILIGPLSGDEGIAVANYAKEHPDKTFINGISGAQDATLKVQAPNFFRFHTRRRAVVGRSRRLRLQRARLEEGRDHRRRLLVPVHVAGRLRGRVLRGRRADHQAHLAAAG